LVLVLINAMFPSRYGEIRVVQANSKQADELGRTGLVD